MVGFIMQAVIHRENVELIIHLFNAGRFAYSTVVLIISVAETLVFFFHIRQDMLVDVNSL